MKRYSLLILLCCFVVGCNKEENMTVNNNAVDIEVEKIPKYEDENPVKISLYVDNTSGGLDRVNGEFKETWRKKRDIAVFGSVFSESDQLEADYFQNIWKNNAQKYDDYQVYKTGWYVNFKLIDGTIYDQMIFGPSDVVDFYDYLEIYLYDSANVPIGVWYSHLTEKDMTSDTIMTSMKLTAGSKFEQIDGEITVTVFTYDSEDDFGLDGKYRGNSMSIVKVYNN